ncbi:MAG: hypothetical protein EZS28_001938 [Streblomastix strix]|uniref:Uncharacterized protein n=1 Tax=Streblomastix strix TaxID=222440 RepID=A0A5J4X5N3_9EUKA|nr:MAG: hypothetical protein EZS28_001938 [Streblomastix strix]
MIAQFFLIQLSKVASFWNTLASFEILKFENIQSPKAKHGKNTQGWEYGQKWEVIEEDEKIILEDVEVDDGLFLFYQKMFKK